MIFGDVYDALGEVQDDRSTRTAIDQYLGDIGAMYAREIISLAPDGARWTDDFTKVPGRPSLRLFGVTLEQGWKKPAVDTSRSSGEMSLSNTAPHVGIVLSGSPKHDEPLPKNLGVEMKWNRDGSWVKRKFVSHPGYKGSNFVEYGARQVDDDAEEMMKDLAEKILFNPMRRAFTRGD